MSQKQLFQQFSTEGVHSDDQVLKV